MNKTNIYVTEHAYKRAKERLGWSRNTTARIVSKIYENGTCIRDIKGSLRPWTEKKLERGGSKESRIYGDMLYVISGGMLITLYHVPTKVRIQNRICKKHMAEFTA